MWVVYRKSDGTVVGTSADSEIDIEKEKALAEVIAGRENLGNPEDYDAYQIKEQGSLESWGESAARGLVKVTPNTTGGMDLVEQPATEIGPSEVVVTTSAKEFHPVDNVPLLPGDGESFLVVTLQVFRDTGETSLKPLGDGAMMAPIGGEEEPTEDNVIWLRPSHGSIREDNDTTREEIRSVTLVDGVARFRFYSEPAKRLTTIQMLSSNPNLVIDSLLVEFI